jgi:hypothetical protein
LTRRDALAIILLLACNGILVGPSVAASEHVTNGNFSAGFASWRLPPSTGDPREGILNNSWLRSEDPCLSLTMWSRKGLDYDSRVVSQRLDLEIGHGEWLIGGFMDRAEVGSQSDVLTMSVVILLRDETGDLRLFRYAHFIKGNLASTQSEGVVEVGGKHPFARSFSGDIESYWGAAVEGWRIVGVELRVEFWDTRGDDVTVNAVFDEISLISRGTPWALARAVLLSSFVVIAMVSLRTFRRR